MKALAGLLLAIMLALGPQRSFAVNPDEMLADPALEARAEGDRQGLRCLVCQNESIEASDADLAHDLRVLVRERRQGRRQRRSGQASTSSPATASSCCWSRSSRPIR